MAFEYLLFKEKGFRTSAPCLLPQAINCSFEKSSASACAKVKEMGHVLMHYAASIWEIADVFNLLVFVYQALLIMSHYIRGKPGTLFVGSRDKYI